MCKGEKLNNQKLQAEIEQLQQHNRNILAHQLDQQQSSEEEWQHKIDEL